MDNKQLRPIMYLTYFPKLRDIANKHGYALAFHGSVRRDFDLILVPWVENADNHLKVLFEWCEFIGCVIPDKQPYHNKEVKPHNRVAYTIQTGLGGYIDVSVIIPNSPRLVEGG